jgi:hypothetical protein
LLDASQRRIDEQTKTAQAKAAPVISPSPMPIRA